MKLKATKSPTVVLAVALACFWAFGVVRADAELVNNALDGAQRFKGTAVG